MRCLTCNNILTGLQTKYCGRNCKNTNTNFKHKNYENQKDKGFKNKIKLLNLRGCKCEMCGYNKNSSALCFHHLRDKKFNLDIRHCSNTSWKRLVEELEKCVVLCHNCHMETHHPDHEMVRPLGVEPSTNAL